MYMLKTLIRDWLPPVLLRLIRVLRRNENRFEGDYKTWDEAAALCRGYDAKSILDKVLQATLIVKSGEAVFERDSVIFDEVHYSWPVTAALLFAAARNKGKLHVLDFGGSLGSSYYQHRKFLSHLDEYSWNVVEQAHFVEAGRKYVEDENLKFFISIQESVSVQPPNVILFSSVVQYVSDLDFLFEQINALEGCVLIFDRTPFSSLPENKICIQYVSDEIYGASYPMWILSKNHFFSQLKKWDVLENFTCPEGFARSSSGITFEFSGCVLGCKYD